MLRSILNFIRRRALVLGIGALALLLRLLAVPASLGTMDEVHFASALTRYDLLRQSPHAPGYPVFVAFARAFHQLGLSDVWALALPGILLSAVTIPWLASVVARRWEQRSGVVTGVVLAAAPLAVVVGGAPASDSIGFALCVGVVAAVLSAMNGDRLAGMVAGVLFGLLLGARVSHAPLAFAAIAWLVWMRRELLLPILLCAIVTTLAWGVPFVIVVGWSTLRELVPIFAQGHLTQWGKGLVAAESAGDPMLWLRWIGLGLVLPGVGFVGAWRAGETRSDGRPLLIALMTACYGAWMVLAQNPEHARHAVPLAIPFALALGLLGESVSLPRLTLGATALVASAAAISLPIRMTQPAAVQLTEHLLRVERPESFQLFGGSEVAVVQYEAPMYRAARPVTEAQLTASTDTLRLHGVRVLATSTVLRRGEAIATFREPSLFAWPRSLQLLLPQRSASERALTMGP